MAVDPVALRHSVDAALNDVQSILTLVDNFPLPAEVKHVVVQAAAVLGDVKEFLAA